MTTYLTWHMASALEEKAVYCPEYWLTCKNAGIGLFQESCPEFLLRIVFSLY